MSLPNKGKSGARPKKYAVMWASGPNLGDDIQTLAGINFLKKKGISEYSFIDRERLSDYKGERVNLVMNGWFTQRLKKFPPPDNVNPIFISFHVARPQLIKRNIAYFKKHEPIGCRDRATVQLFRKHGIDAYFTGCLTLFFDESKEKSSAKYMVDLDSKCWYIPNLGINKSQFKGFTEIEHDIKGRMDLDERMDRASSLLDMYRKAKLVITTRLHCVLPCRAFNTDCVFIHKNYKSDPRFKGLRSIINGSNEVHDSKTIDRKELFEIRERFNNFKL